MNLDEQLPDVLRQIVMAEFILSRRENKMTKQINPFPVAIRSKSSSQDGKIGEMVQQSGHN